MARFLKSQRSFKYSLKLNPIEIATCSKKGQLMKFVKVWVYISIKNKAIKKTKSYDYKKSYVYKKLLWNIYLTEVEDTGKSYCNMVYFPCFITFALKGFTSFLVQLYRRANANHSHKKNSTEGKTNWSSV